MASRMRIPCCLLDNLRVDIVLHVQAAVALEISKQVAARLCVCRSALVETHDHLLEDLHVHTMALRRGHQTVIGQQVGTTHNFDGLQEAAVQHAASCKCCVRF